MKGGGGRRGRGRGDTSENVHNGRGVCVWGGGGEVKGGPRTYIAEIGGGEGGGGGDMHNGKRWGDIKDIHNERDGGGGGVSKTYTTEKGGGGNIKDVHGKGVGEGESSKTYTTEKGGGEGESSKTYTTEKGGGGGGG